jgi:RHS repeat-associated protein
MSQTITVPTVGSNTGFTAVQNYSYDSLNRLKDAIENITPNGGSQSQSWKQTFTFDRYGNRRFDESNTTMPTSFTNQALTNPTISTSNNRLSSTGWDYDSTGNTTDDPNGREFVYDAENKQVKVTDGADVLGEYWYDGDGRRVRKHVRSTGEVTVFVYDAASKLIAEYSTIVETTNAKVGYVSNDHLGSPRINTDANGAVTSRHDYHPFGEEIATSQRTTGVGYADDMVRKQFTGYERDKETELDYARARMFGYSTGRFTSPDPLAASAKAGIPQSWNRYTYVLNNPLVLVDRTGKKWGYYDDENGKRHFHYFSGNAGKFGGHTYSNYTGPRVLTNTNGGTVRLLDGGRYRVLRPLQTAASSTPRANRATQTNSGYVNHELVNELAKRTENIPAFVGTAMGASAAAGVVCAAACPAAAGLTLTEIAAGGAAAAPEVGFVLSQLPGKDSIIFQEAISGGAAAEAPFIDNLMKLTEAVQRVIGMHANVTKLGEINGSEVFGSNATRIGIASIDGVTMIVNMAGDKPQILGPLQ